MGVSWFSSQACNAILQKVAHTAVLWWASLVHGIWCISGIVELLLRNCYVVQGSPCVGTDSVTTVTGWEHILGITWCETPEEKPGRTSWHVHVGSVPLSFLQKVERGRPVMLWHFAIKPTVNWANKIPCTGLGGEHSSVIESSLTASWARHIGEGRERPHGMQASESFSSSLCCMRSVSNAPAFKAACKVRVCTCITQHLCWKTAGRRRQNGCVAPGCKLGPGEMGGTWNVPAGNSNYHGSCNARASGAGRTAALEFGKVCRVTKRLLGNEAWNSATWLLGSSMEGRKASGKGDKWRTGDHGITFD